MTAPIKQAASARNVASATKKAADATLYAAQIARQRERYASAYGRCNDGERCTAARALVTVATLFERDGGKYPKRLKKAVEALKLAVFMLDPKAPA